MLMDATMATGAAAMMAIRVLLDHDVPQENIYLLALIMAESGVYAGFWWTVSSLTAASI